MLRRRAEHARTILREFVAERFVFTPNPAGGYLFKGVGDLGLLQSGVPNGMSPHVTRRFPAGLRRELTRCQRSSPLCRRWLKL